MTKKETITFWEFIAPRVALLVVLSLGWQIGMLLGLVEDFGLTYAVSNIKLNPATFANQYGWQIMAGGYIAVLAFIVILGLAVIYWVKHARRHGKEA